MSSSSASAKEDPLTHPTIPPGGCVLLANLIYQDLQMLCVSDELSKRQVEAAAAVLSRLVPSSQGFEVAVCRTEIKGH